MLVGFPGVDHPQPVTLDATGLDYRPAVFMIMCCVLDRQVTQMGMSDQRCVASPFIRTFCVLLVA
jgi:hypothetical protein